MDMNILKEQPEAINEDSAEKLFLIDDNLFSKYQFLFENKKNYEYLKRVKTNSLIYSKRFYPISKDQLEMIKKNIVETQKSDADKADEKIEAKVDNFDSVDTANEKASPLPPPPLPSPPLPPLSSLNGQEKGDEQASNALESNNSPNLDAQNKTSRQRKIIWKPSVWTCFKPRGKKDGV